MKKILLIGSELGKGGAERSISLLSYYLARHHDVTLCILSGKDRTRHYKTCEQVVFIDPPEATGVWGKVTAWRYRLRKVKALKERLKPDVSISFIEGPDYVNILTKGQEQVVLSIRGSKQFDAEISGLKGKIRKKLLIPRLYRRADHIVCVTEAMKQEMTRYFGIAASKLSVINNFYEIEEIDRKAAETVTELPPAFFERPVIVCSGRLHMAKGFDKMITILAALRKTVDARLLLLGDGPLLEPLKELAAQHGLRVGDFTDARKMETDNGCDVCFLGYQPNPFKFYKRAHVFVLSSLWEGFPNVLAEAMICGTRVVSANCPTGPAEIFAIGDEPLEHRRDTPYGSLMPAFPPELDEATIRAWSEALQYQIAIALAEVETESSTADIRNRFSVAAIIKQWEALIK